MAKQIGILPIQGSMNNMTFYKTADGVLVKTQSKVSRDKIMSGENFELTRQNMSEFSRAAQSGKVLRACFHDVIGKAKDSRVAGRLTGRFLKVVKTDPTSARGLRTVGLGEQMLLKGFEFNNHSTFSTIFKAPFVYAIDRATGKLTVDIDKFVSGEMIQKPLGCTHFNIICAGAEIDFESGETKKASFITEHEVFSNVNNAGPYNISLDLTPNSPDSLLLCLGVQFYQQVNGGFYPMKNGSYNAVKILDVNQL
jgi:hypothetical protein